MTQLVDDINPRVVIFIQYEYWYYLLRTLNNKDMPYIYYGVKLSANHSLTKPYMRFLREKVNQSKLILVRDDDSLKFSKQIFDTRVYNVGDVRWLQAESNVKSNPLDFDHLDPDTIVLGSVWKEDLILWLPIINERLDLNFVIAPHDISRQFIQEIQSSLNADSVLYSEKKNGNNSQTKSRITVIDTIGDLKYLYKGARIVYIGGGLGNGLHNCIEPAVYGIPIIVSGVIDNNPEVKKLVANGFATRIDSSEEITQAISKYMANAQLESYESYIAAEIAQCQQALSLLDSEIYV
jgi:3-deoxy-D-manno-octulosonic-acid transferase